MFDSIPPHFELSSGLSPLANIILLNAEYAKTDGKYMLLGSQKIK